MDITKFCATDDGRFPLSKPWVKDGWRYATDARIAVREPTTEPDTDNRTETIEGLFDEPIPDVDMKVPRAVPTHDGKGVQGTRPACMAVENPTTETCAKVGFCTADGAWDCTADGDDECPNMVDWSIPANLRFAGKLWNGIYIVLINKQLPGAQCIVRANGYMYFWLGDVEGILAPMKG